MENDSEPGSASLPHGFRVSGSTGQRCPPVAMEDIGVGWEFGEGRGAGSPGAHLLAGRKQHASEPRTRARRIQTS